MRTCPIEGCAQCAEKAAAQAEADLVRLNVNLMLPTLVMELRDGIGHPAEDMTWEEELFSRAADSIEAIVRENAKMQPVFDFMQAINATGVDQIHAFVSERDALRAVIEKVRALCHTMDRGVGYRVSGDHSTWGEYHEGQSDFAGAVEEMLGTVEPITHEGSK